MNGKQIINMTKRGEIIKETYKKSSQKEICQKSTVETVPKIVKLC